MNAENRPNNPSGNHLDGQAYAWGKTARLVTEDHFFSVLRESPNFTAADLCSAYPFFSRVMKGQYRVKTHRATAKYVGGLFHNVLSRKVKLERRFPSLLGISDEEYQELREELEQHDDDGRHLLRAPLFELISTPPNHLVGPKTKEKTEEIKDIIKHKLQMSSVVYSGVREAAQGDTDEGWELVQDFDLGSTFLGIVESALGRERALAFIDELTNDLGEKLSGTLRQFTMISLDVKQFKEINRETKRSFPKGLRKTFFFKSARAPGSHIQGDLKNLPFAPESVSFVSCIEGWPFYLSDLGVDGQISIAGQIIEMLQPGGRAVFFPWRFQGQTLEHRNMLKQVEEFWKSKGMNVFFETSNIQDIQEEMSDREYMLVDRSPVFKERVKRLTTLIIEKPKAA